MYEDNPVPLAKGHRLLDEYQHAVASTYRPDVRKAVLALNELVGRARETIARLKSIGGGMFYFARVYSGDHDTAKVEALLKSKWPNIRWDVEAYPTPDVSDIDDERERAKLQLPLYRMFTGDQEIPDFLETVNTFGELELSDGQLAIAIF